ncbi:MAG: hypothetical protein JSV51_08910 [Candidatus Bathyarchaeota archaeon]|nr:MAG: hypothetical protein JSV51_08910 [Candidatus Bathyarchaeota archaeon]
MYSNKSLAIISVIITIGILAISPSLSVLTSSILIPTSGRISSIGSLHVEGRHIKDDYGNTVFLRGVNYYGYNFDPYGDWNAPGDPRPHRRMGTWDDSRPKAHYEELRDVWGGNAMRWTLAIEYWLENTDNHRYWVRRGIELAQEYGIYIILAPWRVQGGADWDNDPLPFPPYTHTGASIIANEQAFIDFWVSVATELKDLPNWIIDPYNEPHMVTTASHDTDRAAWFDVISRLINEVRAITDHIILVQWMEGVWYGGYNNMNRWLDDFINYLEIRNTTRNIVISTHNYHDAYTYWGYPQARPNNMEQLLQDYTVAGLTYAATEIDYPLLIGEIGANDESTGEEWVQEKIWYNNTLSLYNEWGLSYIGWMWASPRESGRVFTLWADGDWIPPPSEEGLILIDAIRRG